MNFNFPLCRILHVVGGDLQDVVTGTAEAPNVFVFQLRLTIKTPKEDSCPPIKLDGGGGGLKRATFLNLIQRLPTLRNLIERQSNPKYLVFLSVNVNIIYIFGLVVQVIL